MQGMAAREKKPRKAMTEMGERHHIWYNSSSRQSGGGQVSISRRYLGRDVVKRICSEKKVGAL